jgi:hypothetical protein
LAFPLASAAPSLSSKRAPGGEGSAICLPGFACVFVGHPGFSYLVRAVLSNDPLGSMAAAAAAAAAVAACQAMTRGSRLTRVSGVTAVEARLRAAPVCFAQHDLLLTCYAQLSNRGRGAATSRCVTATGRRRYVYRR